MILVISNVQTEVISAITYTHKAPPKHCKAAIPTRALNKCPPIMPLVVLQLLQLSQIRKMVETSNEASKNGVMGF